MKFQDLAKARERPALASRSKEIPPKGRDDIPTMGKEPVQYITPDDFPGVPNNRKTMTASSREGSPRRPRIIIHDPKQ